MVKVENIYKYRSCIRELYSKDVSLEGDIINDIGSVRDEYKVAKIETNISDYYIGIEMTEDYTQYDINNVISRVSDSIQNFIIINSNNIHISPEDKEEFEEFVQNSKLLYDMTIVGRLIRFSL